MNPFIKTILATGIMFPPMLFASYWIRPKPESDVITIGTMVCIMLVAVFGVVALSKLNDKPLIYTGLTGYLISAVTIALYVKKALAPITW